MEAILAVFQKGLFHFETKVFLFLAIHPSATK